MYDRNQTEELEQGQNLGKTKKKPRHHFLTQ